VIKVIDNIINKEEQENIKNFLQIYNSEQGSIIMSEEKLLNMLRYFKLHTDYNVKGIENYGKHFRQLHENFKDVDRERQRYYGNSDKLLSNYIENPTFLIATYNRLKRSISNRTQYIILKDAIICLSPMDVEHFINMILRKYTSVQINKVIDKIQTNK